VELPPAADELRIAINLVRAKTPARKHQGNEA